jgi:hypothetical protein
MTRRFEPTEQERTQVAKMSGFGLPVEMVAALVRHGIAAGTLRRAFKQELERGRASAAAQIAETLFQKALGGDAASIFFYLKCRVPGWREIQRTEVTAADGAPLLPRASGVMIVPATMDAKEWEATVSKQQAALMESRGKTVQ